MATYTVGTLVGSIATGSINRQLAQSLRHVAPSELQLTDIPIKDLPLYSYDYDKEFPPVAKDFKNAVAQVDAVLFVTPEYNRSIPGALKNAIDWASRPYGHNSFARKPSAVMGMSTGKIGTAVGQQHLRSILGYCNSPQMNSMEVYLQYEKGFFGTNGEVTNAKTADFLRRFMAEFHGFISRVYIVLPKGEPEVC